MYRGTAALSTVADVDGTTVVRSTLAELDCDYPRKTNGKTLDHWLTIDYPDGCAVIRTPDAALDYLHRLHDDPGAIWEGEVADSDVCEDDLESHRSSDSGQY